MSPERPGGDYDEKVDVRRVYRAGVVFGVTLAAAVWLLTYRAWTLFEYIDRTGRHFHASERVRVQPWWSVPATVSFLLAGSAFSVWLLPGRRGPLRRLADHFSNVAQLYESRRGNGTPRDARRRRIDTNGA
jgi:hypothetical protein